MPVHLRGIDMPDHLYTKVRYRIERHLSGSPRRAIQHSLLFSLFTVSFGLLSLLTYLRGAANSFVYLGILFWSVLLFAHWGYLYWRSGAWKPRRERLIQEEILDAGDTYELSEDEMISLHLELSDEIASRSEVFERGLFNAAGNVFLWPGMLFVMVFFQQARIWMLQQSNDPYQIVLFVGMIGTLLLSFTLPVRALRSGGQSAYRDLRDVYGSKRKRDAMRSNELDDIDALEWEAEKPKRLISERR
jgi:hypothetical protein